jgi:hypothetical protein
VKQHKDNACAETALYPPLKAFFEQRGYEVKGEVRGCDLVARRGEEPPIIVELKLRFNLPLVLQGIARLALADRVYLAVPRVPATHRRRAPPERPEIRKLCRRIGLGLILVGLSRGTVEILEEPLPYRPRQAKSQILRLVDEFSCRNGDCNIGGAVGVPIITAYRQDALRCARALALHGPMRIGAIRIMAGVPKAAPILQRNAYGWFARIERGTYRLTQEGDQALNRFADALSVLPP